MAAAEKTVKETLLEIAQRHDEKAAAAKEQLCGVMREAIEVLAEIDRARSAAARFRAAAESGRIE